MRNKVVLISVCAAVLLAAAVVVVVVGREVQRKRQEKLAGQRKQVDDINAGAQHLSESLTNMETEVIEEKRRMELKMKGTAATSSERSELADLDRRADERRIKYLDSRRDNLDSVEREELRLLSEREAKRRIESNR